jgi:tetratricopeptide (TPR) repeat protein
MSTGFGTGMAGSTDRAARSTGSSRRPHRNVEGVDPTATAIASVTPTHHRRRRTPTALVNAEAVVLIGVPLVALGLMGAARPWQLAVVHLVAASMALVYAFFPDASLQYAGRAWRTALAGAIVASAPMLGLVPLPRSVLEILSPGVAAARPDDAWWTLALDPVNALSETGTILLFSAYALAVGIWSARARRALEVEAIAAGLTALILFTASVHLFTGATALFGMLPLEGEPRRFFAPLGNGNHTGTLLLLTLPVLLYRGFDPERQGLDVWMHRTLAIGSLGMIAAIGSVGVFASLAVQLVWLAARWRGIPVLGGLVGALAALPALAGVAVAAALDPEWWEKSAGPRLVQWSDIPRMAVDHWFAGVGGDSFGEGYRPYKSMAEFAYFRHAHSDVLEWWAETGLVGMVLAAAAVWCLPPWEAGLRRGLWSMGLIGVAVHTCMDFPLHIPAVGLLVAGALAIRLTAFESEWAINPRLVRWTAVAFGLAQLPAAGVQGWRAVVQPAEAALSDPSPTDGAAIDAAATLERWRPDAPMLSLYRGLSAARAGDKAGAATAARAAAEVGAHDADVLRRAGRLLAVAGHLDEAVGLVNRAEARDPSDFRTFGVRSEIYRAQSDREGAAKAWADALRHWPREQRDGAAPIRRALELQPEGLWWLDQLADAPAFWSADLAVELLERGDAEVALLAVEQAARLRPMVYGRWPPRAHVLMALGRADEAEAWARACVKAEPENPFTWNALGKVLVDRQKPAEAIDAFFKALELDRTNGSYAVSALRAGAAAGGPERALGLLERVEVYVPHHADVALTVAELYADAGNVGACHREITRNRLLDSPVPRIAREARALGTRCTVAPQGPE